MNDLKALRVRKDVTARDMVRVVRKLYPKYDKTVQSKCENSDLYGAVLAPDAMKALYDRFDPERETAIAPPRKDNHRLTCSIRARLEKPVYDLLQQLIRAEGYATAQAWLTAKILDYLKKEGYAHD